VRVVGIDLQEEDCVGSKAHHSSFDND